jgi:hypothetical protein
LPELTLGFRLSSEALAGALSLPIHTQAQLHHLKVINYEQSLDRPALNIIVLTGKSQYRKHMSGKYREGKIMVSDSNLGMGGKKRCKAVQASFLALFFAICPALSFSACFDMKPYLPCYIGTEWHVCDHYRLCLDGDCEVFDVCGTVSIAEPEDLCGKRMTVIETRNDDGDVCAKQWWIWESSLLREYKRVQEVPEVGLDCTMRYYDPSDCGSTSYNPIEFLPEQACTTDRDRKLGDFCGQMCCSGYCSEESGKSYFTYLGTETVTVPAGTFSCIKVSIHVSISTSAAASALEGSSPPFCPFVSPEEKIVQLCKKIKPDAALNGLQAQAEDQTLWLSECVGVVKFHVARTFSFYGYDISFEWDREGLSAPPSFTLQNYDFDAGAGGWSFSGAVAPFSPPNSGAFSSGLWLGTINNTDCFGYWRSPDWAIWDTSNQLYLARFYLICLDQTQPLVPILRLRANASNLQQSDWLEITSNDQGESSPDATGRGYYLFFGPAVNTGYTSLAFDVLNFSPADAPQATVGLDSVEIYACDTSCVSIASVAKHYPFDTGAEGWAFSGTVQPFSEPNTGAYFGALHLASRDHNTFGYWYSPMGDVPLSATPTLYRATFRLHSDQTDVSLVPELRLRLFSSNFQTAVVKSCPSTGNGSNSPSQAGRDYPLYYWSPTSVPTGDLQCTFDLLNFSPDDAPQGTLSLDDVMIETLGLPCIP